MPSPLGETFIKKPRLSCPGFFLAVIVELVRPGDEPGAVEEQNAHKTEQHNAGQHREEPVALQNKAARRAGQQCGDGQADEDGRGKLLWPHPCVCRRIRDDAVGQPRRDEREDRIKPRVFAAAHAVQQLGGLLIGTADSLHDLLQREDDEHAPLFVQPAVAYGQSHAIQHQIIQDFRVCCYSPEAGLGHVFTPFSFRPAKQKALPESNTF